MTRVEVLCLPAIPYISHKSRDNGHGDRLMATIPTVRLSTRRRLDDLSSELLVLIFEQLWDVDSSALPKLREVSRRLNDIVTPIRYRSLRVNKHTIDPPEDVKFPLPQALQTIYTRTRRVEARSNLSGQGVKRLLDRVGRLSEFKWFFVQSDVDAGTYWTPSDVLNQRHLDTNQTKVHIENLPLPNDNIPLAHIYTRGIPARNLDSLILTPSNPPLTTRLEPLKRLLLRARNLRALHYWDSGQGTRFSGFAPGERLPAFEELTLQSYDWDHDATFTAAHWDFSRLRELKLIDVPDHPFLTAVPPHALRELQVLWFHSIPYLSSSPFQSREDRESHDKEVTDLLANLTLGIRALRELEITCHVRLFSARCVVDQDETMGACRGVLLRHAPTLRVLRLRDHVGFDDSLRHCPTLRAVDLGVLACHLTNLRELDLDLDLLDCDRPESFMKELCEFPRLEALTLHMRTTMMYPADFLSMELQSESDAEHGDSNTLTRPRPARRFDGDHEAVRQWFETLVQGKEARRQRGDKTVPWRRIKFVVGGWRNVMVRRTDLVWRELNKRGVYAEHCFLFERDPNVRDGPYVGLTGHEEYREIKATIVEG